MKVYVDGLFYKATGIGRFYSSLVKGLCEHGIEVHTCVARHNLKEFTEEMHNYKEKLKVYEVSYSKFSPKAFIFHRFILKKIETQVQAFLFPHLNLSLYFPDRSITVIHDLIPLSEFWDRGALKRLIIRFLYKEAIRKSKRLVAISETVLHDLVKHFPEAERELKDKGLVIYNFLDDLFSSVTDDCTNISGIPYILYVGNRKIHKNISTLLRAFAVISEIRPDLKLVIVGKKEKSPDYVDIEIERLGIFNRVIQLTNASDAELKCMYKHALLLVMPSMYEGFGLPPLEAISQGCPFILSDIPVFRELYGEEGIFFNPTDYRELAEKLLNIISNHEYRKELVVKQKNVLKKFNKDKSIKAYIELIKEVG